MIVQITDGQSNTAHALCRISAILWEMLKDTQSCQALVVHAFNPTLRRQRQVELLSLRPAWSTQQVPGHWGLQETMSKRKRIKKKKDQQTPNKQKR